MTKPLDTSDLVRLERLFLLRRAVDRSPESHFIMDVLGEEEMNYEDYGDDVKKKDVKKTTTVRCAAGWAAMDPVVQAQGFRLVEGWPEYTDPDGTVHEGMDACAAFFQLSESDAENLFEGGYAVMQQEVIDNIDRLIDGKPAIEYLPDPKGPILFRAFPGRRRIT